ncbi:hypothetical protein PIB30_062847 [Stylosanthes scabra]|uniref:Uncharacterized protein n=1 Tax=Stylosanthes scabra TaxID=79078 RepID=A0ABU6XJ57_9FABA|nr:hypothetical protein [Stylosanthes scabra]
MLPLEYKFKLFWLEGDVHVWAMFDMHHRYEPRQVMELLVETRDVNRSEAGPSSSRAGPMGAIAAPTTLDRHTGDDGSNGEYMGETKELDDSFDEAEYVAETQHGRRFLLPAPAAIPDLSSVSSHFHTLNLDAMQEEPRDGYGGGE